MPDPARPSFWIRLMLISLWLVAAPGLGVAPDGDGDGVRDPCDNCRDVSNPLQVDSDGDGFGNQCDADFDGDGLVSANDFFATFRPCLGQSATGDCAVADLDADGLVSATDFFSRFRPTLGGPPGPAAAPSAVVSGSCSTDDDPDCADPYEPGGCFERRVGTKAFGEFPTSDGCSLTPDQLPGFPSDGNVNNPTDEIVSRATLGGSRCPNAAFGTFLKPGAICGIDVPLSVCGEAKNGLPCSNEKLCVGGADAGETCEKASDCAGSEDPDAPEPTCGEVFCGDPDRPLACEQHDTCGQGGATCGYRQKQCDNQFRRNLFRTCEALEGLERLDCRDTCLAFANLYALAKDGAGMDVGVWSQADLAHQEDVCQCCPEADEAGSFGAVCGDTVCRADLGESCGTCSECCEIADGGVCFIDDDCASGACLEDGRCGVLPDGARCESDASCESGSCTAGVCCGAGAACDVLCLTNDDCSSGICNFARCIDDPLDDFVPCSTSAACESGACVAGLCSPVKLPNGAVCLDDPSCESGICNLGVCLAEPGPPGIPCTTSAACEDGNDGSGECSSGICIQNCAAGLCNGSPCVLADQCQSGLCELLVCSACGEDDDCDSGACAFNRCYPTPAPDGSPCDSAGDCLADECVLFTCGSGPPCLTNGDCSGQGIGVCSFGFCLPFELPNGEPCTTDAACQSDTCNLGSCVAAGTKGAGSICTTDNVCRSGNCVGGLCASRCGDGFCDGTERCGSSDGVIECNDDCGTCSNGSLCGSDSDCTSNNCVAGFCAPDCRIFGATCSRDSQCCSGNCRDVIVGSDRCGS